MPVVASHDRGRGGPVLIDGPDGGDDRRGGIGLGAAHSNPGVRRRTSHARHGWRGVTVEVLSWVQDHRAQIAIGLIAVLLAAPVVWISGHPVAWWQRRKETEAVRKARKSARSGRGGTSNHDSSY